MKPLYETEDSTELSPYEQAIASSLSEKGYAILESLFDDQLLDRVIQDCDGKYQNDSIHLNENRRITDGWRSIESVCEIACDTRIINLLSKLYGRRAFPFQTLNFNVGTEQRLHSDTIHFNSIPNSFMTGVWVALEDVTLDNGPLAYIENSHKLPIFNCDSIGVKPSSPKMDPYVRYSEYENFVEGLLDLAKEGPRFSEMKKGDVFIWTANLIHGGSPIKQEGSTRLSQVTHYFYEDCVYFTPLSSDLRNAKLHLRLPLDISSKKRVPLSTLLKSLQTCGFSTSSIIRSLAYSKFGI